MDAPTQRHTSSDDPEPEDEDKQRLYWEQLLAIASRAIDGGCVRWVNTRPW